jgi:hypothetical protein
MNEAERRALEWADYREKECRHGRGSDVHLLLSDAVALTSSMTSFIGSMRRLLLIHRHRVLPAASWSVNRIVAVSSPAPGA